MKIETLPSADDISVTSREVYSYPAHIHTYTELILYEPFAGFVMINDRKIEADTCFVAVIAPGDLHRVEILDGKNARFVKACLPAAVVDFSAMLRLPQAEDFLIRIFQELTTAEDHTNKRLLTDLALHRLRTEGEPIQRLKNTAANQLVIEALKLLRDGFGEGVTLNSVSKQLFVSAPYLSKIFKEAVGCGFADYLGSVRLSKAAQLLQSTTKAVAEICLECGFNNLSHFVRKFKKHYGCAPSQFRKQERES